LETFDQVSPKSLDLKTPWAKSTAAKFLPSASEVMLTQLPRSGDKELDNEVSLIKYEEIVFISEK
jgi:hypothetical protein